LSVGFTGGYLQYSFDASKATFNNQYVNGHFDPNNPILETLPNPKFTVLDAGAGINFNTSRGEDNNVTYMIGVSGYHFNQANFSYYQIPGLTQDIRWNVNLGLSCLLSDKLSIMLQGNYALQGAYTEAIFGGLVSWSTAEQNSQDLFVLSCGVFYRYGDAIIPVVKIKHKNMSLGFSYDVNISSLQDASNMAGGYEITLFMSGNYSNNDGKNTVCPRF
jgi:type IX secretion system PorP/SprF family membrane protein